MNVAGRQDESEILQNVLLEMESSFVAVYGRRRIGKTYLIRQVYKEQMVFDCSGLHEKNNEQQLESFNNALSAWFLKNRENQIFNNWLQAFEALKKHISSIRNKKKKVIFFDEIAWFDIPKSGFKAALDNFWNQFASKRSDIVLVICGSSASWIINKIINDRGGFHNRITTKIELQPFTLKETFEYMQLKNLQLATKDIVQLYMAIGGVPFYFKDIKRGQSVPQIIQQLFFDKNAALKNEFSNLYAALFKNSDSHVSIIKSLATKNKGLTRNEILAQTKLTSGGGFTTVLSELVICGFVKEIFPIDKDKANVLYRLMDNFSIFYFKFLYNKKIANYNWLQMANTTAYKVWCGFAFENICLQHILSIKKMLGISGIVTNEYSWQKISKDDETGVQIDFIIDRNDNCINLCEAKFYDAKFEVTKQYADKLREKKAIFMSKTKTKKNVFITLITLFGATPNAHYNSIVTNQLVEGDLFK